VRVLLIGSHRSNNLEDFASNAFERLGHQVRFLGHSEYLPMRPDVWASATTRLSGPFFNFGTKMVLRRFQSVVLEVVHQVDPDLIVVFKGEGIAPSTIARLRSRTSCPVALWYPDDPRFFNTFSRWIAPSYDFVFTYLTRGVELYRSLGLTRVYCVPFGCDPMIHRALPKGAVDSEGPEIVFVGTYTPRRAGMIRCLQRVGYRPSVFGPHWNRMTSGGREAVFGKSMARLYSSAKVTLNFHMVPGWGPNMRVFEATASGAFLLTDDCEDLGRYYLRGKELEVFRDSKELCEKVRYFVTHDEDREEIARAGCERTQREHTYDARMKAILACIGS
jgi:spore maturation protein CgeB